MQLEHIEVILKNYEQMSFEDLLKLRLNFGRLPKDLYEHYLGHELRGLKRGEERLRKIKFMLSSLGKSLVRKENCLELGCGMGGGLITLSKVCKKVVGLDISKIDLLLAKKQIEENKIGNVELVCDSGEKLPFEDETFDLIIATDVIEHVANQEKFLKEAHRVLQRYGFFYFNSPNRFNIFGPEPHVRVWGVGFLPRRYISKFVKAIKGVDYKGKRLLSYFELLRLLRKKCGNSYRIFGMIADNSKTDKSLKRKFVYKLPWIIKLLNWGLKLLITQYHVIVFKNSYKD